MKKKATRTFTGDDIERMARDFEKPVPESVRKQVFDRVAEINREVRDGKRPPLPERDTIEKEKDRDIGRGRDDD